MAEHQPATNQERALQTIVQQLSKLGDTDFVAKDIQVFANEQPCSDTFPYFIPTSQLNQWRREVINKPSTVNAQLSYTSSASDRSSEREIREFIIHNSQVLQLPHPRMHERDFVMIPLREVEAILCNTTQC